MTGRALAHWALFAAAGAAWALSLYWSSWAGDRSLVVTGTAFLGACVALAVLERVRDALPVGSPRAIAWLLVVLTAAFLPSLALSGAWRGSSMVMLPAVAGTVVSWAAVPWLVSTGPQPSWRDGRATPVLLAWMGLALNAWLSSYG